MDQRGKSHFDIGTLSSLAGVNRSTIRTWENRYQALVPGKTGTGRRIYDESDVKRLILLRNLIARGHKISHLAGLPTDTLQGLVEMAGSVKAARNDLRLPADLLQAIDDFDIERFRRIFAFQVSELPPVEAIEGIIQPTLHLIGERWHAGLLDIAQEHLMSEVIRAQLLSRIEGLKVAERGPLIAFATLSREQHEFGALMACYLASSLQFRTMYLGTNMPPADLATHARRVGADLIVLSSIFVADANLPEIRVLAHQIGGTVPIWVGCDALRFGADAELPDTVEAFSDFAQYHERLQSFQRAQRGQDG